MKAICFIHLWLEDQLIKECKWLEDRLEQIKAELKKRELRQIWLAATVGHSSLALTGSIETGRG